MRLNQSSRTIAATIAATPDRPNRKLKMAQKAHIFGASATITHVVAPDGDTILVLNNPNAPFTIWPGINEWPETWLAEADEPMPQGEVGDLVFEVESDYESDNMNEGNGNVEVIP